MQGEEYPGKEVANKKCIFIVLSVGWERNWMWRRVKTIEDICYLHNLKEQEDVERKKKMAVRDWNAEKKIFKEI